MLNVFGGKITTYRKLAEAALAKITPFFPSRQGEWTAGVALPGGDFAVDGVQRLVDDLKSAYPFLDDYWAGRLVRAYGTEAAKVLGDARGMEDLGPRFRRHADRARGGMDDAPRICPPGRGYRMAPHPFGPADEQGADQGAG